MSLILMLLSTFTQLNVPKYSIPISEINFLMSLT